MRLMISNNTNQMIRFTKRLSSQLVRKINTLIRKAVVRKSKEGEKLGSRNRESEKSCRSGKMKLTKQCQKKSIVMKRDFTARKSVISREKRSRRTSDVRNGKTTKSAQSMKQKQASILIVKNLNSIENPPDITIEENTASNQKLTKMNNYLKIQISLNGLQITISRPHLILAQPMTREPSILILLKMI